MNYYISDLHFGCSNKYENRTLQHDYIIKKNWNEVVHNNDTVYILGDIGRIGTSRENEYLCQIVSTLKGNKILIQGNHDKMKDNRLRQLFTEIISYKEITDNFNNLNYNIVLSHYPILMWNNQHKGWIHLYGHVHNSDEYDLYKKSLGVLNDHFESLSLSGRTDCPQVKSYNVGCMLDYMEYTPKTLKEILNSFQK